MKRVCFQLEPGFYEHALLHRGGKSARTNYRRHLGCLAFASFFFTAEEVWPDAPLFHSAWHMFGTGALASANALSFDDAADDQGATR